MSIIIVKVDTSQAVAVELGELTTLKTALTNVPNTMRLVGIRFERLYANQFVDQTDSYGTGWVKGLKTTGKTLTGTSLLSRSFTRKVTGNILTIGVGGPAAAYAQYHQFGTGIYGPKEARIKPLKAKALRFKGSAGGVVFRKSVAGVPIRLIIPTAARGLPAPWLQEFKRAFGVK